MSIKNTKIVAIPEALQAIRSGSNVFIHSVAAAPQALINGMVARAESLEQVCLYHIHTEGSAPYVEPVYQDKFHDYSFFIGRNVRAAVQENRADYI
ncbi:MAG: 4-hydroxybutyrate CoA-transferase, partial [Saprospiraceae bacterium]